MDIEKLIERLSKYSEPVIAYKLDADFAASITDAISELRCKCDGCSVPATTAEMIRDLNDAPKLRAENEKLRAELEQAERCIEIVEKQRDAAIKDLERLCRDDIGPCKMAICELCAYNSGVQCSSPDGRSCDGYDVFNWKWRGPKKED